MEEGGNTKSRVMSVFICILMITSISASITQNVGQPENLVQSGPSTTSGGTGGLADSPWPMFRQNLNHTGQSPYDTSGNNGQLKWSFEIGDYMLSSPAIGSDGIIYIGSRDNKLYAINPDGSERWSFLTGDIIDSSPAIDSDGIIYVGSSDWKLYAINPDGTEKWNFATNGSIESSPAIGFDGTIYVGSSDCKLYAINPDGTEKWSFITGKGISFSSAGIDSDGTIYIGSTDNKLYAVYPNGTEKWSFETGNYVISSPAIGFDGTIYVTSLDRRLYAINHDGSEKWNNYLGYGTLFSSPAIGFDGTIYVGSGDKKIYAINPDGTEKWNFTTMDHIFHSSPAIGSEGTIYIGSYDFRLYAINPDGTQKWNFLTGWPIEDSPTIGSDGTIYVGSSDGKLYAIGNSPSNLQIDVTSHFSSLNSAAQSAITVHVTDGTNPVQGATVNLVSDNGGIFSPQSGITDVNGDFESIFNAPTVTSQIICRISAETSKSGYNDDSGYVDVAINPIPWPMFRQNLNHTGQSPYDTSTNPGKLKWSFTTGYQIYSSPAIGFDGTIYVGSEDYKIYAINPDGSEKWNFPTGNLVHSSPAIGFDGTIYVGSHDNKLYAINPDGSEKWRFNTGSWIVSSPAIGSDGTIYVGSNDYKLYAINPDGTEKWSFSTNGSISYSSPAIGFDGTIYIGSHDNKLYAINPDGTEKWNFATGDWVNTIPTIGSDGTIYVGSHDNKLYAINPDGSEKWNFVTGNKVHSSPAIGSDGTIYVGSYDKKLYAINPDGTEKWSYTTGNGVRSSPAIGSDGTIYVGSYDNKLYAIKPNGSEKWSFTAGSLGPSSPAIDYEGTIYIGGFNDFILYAINEGGIPPIATVGPDQTVNEGDTVQFNASSSYDPDGTIETYEWDFDASDGLWWETGAVPDATGPAPTHIYGDDGEFNVILRVTDNDNLSATDTCNITVQNVDPTVETGIGEGVTREWITIYDSPRMDWGKDIAVDSLGYVYVTGARSVEEGVQGYDNYITLKYDPDGNKLWEGEYNGPANTEDRPEALALDSSGNVFVTGASYGVGTGIDWATVKYDTSGNELWVARHTSPGEHGDKALAIAVDASGNAYVTGYTDYGGLYSDITIIAYDPDGNELWIANYDGFGNSDRSFDIALDSLGNIYVTGSSRSSGNTDEHYNYTTIKYDSAGNELWVASYDGPANDTDRAYAIAVDLQGNVYVTGQSVGDSPYREFATVKYDTNGNFQWVARYKGSGNNHDWPVDIETDTQGFVYVTGKSYGNGTRTDIATIKYDSSGNELWAVRYDGTGNKWDFPYEMAVDSNGNIYIAAQSFGNGTKADALILAYDTNGNEVWMDRYNGPWDGMDEADAIAVDSQYNVYVTGYQHSIDTAGDIITIKYSPSTHYEGYEGSSITFPATTTDPGSDDLTFTWNWGDGTPDTVTTYYNNGVSPEPVYDPATNEVKSPWGTYPFSVTDTVIHTYGDDGIYNVIITIEDDDGGVSTCTMKVTVHNVAPTIEPFGPLTIDEGSPFDITAISIDPGSDDLTFVWEFEDGPTISNTHHNDGMNPDTYPSPWGTYPFSATDTAGHVYGDDGNFTIALTVRDDDGGFADYETYVMVNNVPPSILSMNYSIVIINKPRTIGYWGHQCEVEEAYGDHTGILQEWVDEISSQSQVFSWISTKEDVCSVVQEGDAEDMIVMAKRQLMGVWLNVVSRKLHPDSEISMPNLTASNTIWEAILEIEDVILNSTDRAELERVKDIADNINNGRGISLAYVEFTAIAIDPGADDLTFHWEFGDGKAQDNFHPNVNGTFPVEVTDYVGHSYFTLGTINVTLIVTDDDGGTTTTTLVIVLSG